MSDAQFERLIQGAIYRTSGRNYPHLLGNLDKLPPEALRDLHRLLQDLEQEVQDAKRKVKLWPGGPSIRM